MSELTWGAMLSSLLLDQTADPDQLRWAMTQTMTGEATPAQIAAWLVALRARNVDPLDINVLLEVMLQHAVKLDVDGITVDTCGTGGDGAHTVNISTMAAVVAAAGGVKVVKHGNRAASSKCGSADVLEQLGIRIDLPPEQVQRVLEEVGITFCFAPAFHPAARFAGPVRRELGIRTVFNVLGPLANPAQLKAQVMGVSDLEVAPVLAEALRARGVKALVLRGRDGLDEISIHAPTDLWVAFGDEVQRIVVEPADFGVPTLPLDALRGYDAEFNAARMRDLFSGSAADELEGTRHAVALTAAAAFTATDAVRGPIPDVLQSLQANHEKALGLIADGAAARKLEQWLAAMPEV